MNVQCPAPSAVTTTVRLGPDPVVGLIVAMLPEVFPLPSEHELEESVNVPL